MNDFPAYIAFMCEKFVAAGGALPWPKLVMAVLLRDEFTCHYCGETRLDMTADHVMPKSRGGGDELSNLVCACNDCNLSKSNRTKDEFLANAKGPYKDGAYGRGKRDQEFARWMARYQRHSERESVRAGNRNERAEA